VPKLAPLAGKWIEVQSGKSGLQVFQPCDADVRSLIFDAVNNQVHVGFGQEVVFLDVQSIKALAKRQFDISAKAESDKGFASLGIQTKADGSIDVRFPDPSWAAGVYVDERASLALPVIPDNSCSE
jgi:hypothetical protein